MRFANKLAKNLRFNTSFLLKFCHKNNKVSDRHEKCEGDVTLKYFSLTCHYPFVHRPLRLLTLGSEGHFRIR